MFLFEKVRSPKYFSERDILRNYTFLRVIFSGIILFEKVHIGREMSLFKISPHTHLLVGGLNISVIM